LFRGIPVLVVLAALFVGNGLVIGWRTAYDVMLAITSPADTKLPVLAWFLSVVGWLIGPAVAGAVAGHMVNAAIGARRKKPIDQLFTEVDADLTDANLTRAKLTDADLTRADLTRAKLTDASLTGAKLTGAVLSGARWSGATIWPAGEAAEIRERSEQIAPDMFRVRRGAGSHDTTSLVTG
jgi:Pentapeptide repeats (8 copies)/Family of unknown function (DUF6313)